MNNNKFTSGNEYCIRELFGDNTKLLFLTCNETIVGETMPM